MAKIADIIKYEGDNSTFIWKHPCEDFNTMTQLIVHESQEAIFFMNGQALDLFGPGRHTLETQNIPLLGKLLNKPTGGETPFHCEVYFINQTVQMGVKWGTPEHVRFIEPTLGIPLGIGAAGEMNLKVCDSRKLLIKLVGTMNGIAWEERGLGFTKSLQSSFRPLITTAVKSHLASSIKAQNINILEIDEHLSDLSETLRQRILPGFEEYGLTVPQLYIASVLLPENDPNFKRLRELHTTNLQIRMAENAASIVEAQRKITIAEEETKTEQARHAADRTLIDIQLKKASGLADAEVMTAQGYNHLHEINADVQKAYAAGMGQMGANGGSGGGGMLNEFVGLSVGMAAAGQMGAQMGNLFGGVGNTAAPAAPAAPVAPAAPTTVTCPSCGKELPATSKFCFECGSKIEVLADNEMICPSCGKKTAKGKFCMECGSPLIRKCSKCGEEVPNGAKFCLQCGEKL